MSKDRDRALSRTTRLINQEFFEGNANDKAISDGLASTTIRLIADEANMSSRAGQAGLITTVQLIARMGIQIELDAPDVDLLLDIPPLRRSTLQAALLELGDDLIPDTSIRTARQHADLTFCFGDTPTDETDVVYVTAGKLSCHLTRDQAHATRIDSDMPIGAFVAGAAAAAIALDTARPNIERATKTSRPPRRYPSPGPPVQIDLAELFPQIASPPQLSRAIDVISGGAVANAFLATQLWLSHDLTTMRVLDNDTVEMDNLNRCTQFRRSDAKQHLAKIDALANPRTSGLQIDGIPERYTETNREQILPFAEHVVVGVDSIPARWRIQEAQPTNLYIGSTTNNEAILTTHHPGQPCAACAHPDEDIPLDDDYIPTISFVSFWAGLLQTCAVLAEAVQPNPSRRITIYPFALGGQYWSSLTDLRSNDRCPLHCTVSTAAFG